MQSALSLFLLPLLLFGSRPPRSRLVFHTHLRITPTTLCTTTFQKCSTTLQNVCPKSYLYIYDFQVIYTCVPFQSVGSDRYRVFGHPVLPNFHPEGPVSQQDTQERERSKDARIRKKKERENVKQGDDVIVVVNVVVASAGVNEEEEQSTQKRKTPRRHKRKRNIEK